MDYNYKTSKMNKKKSIPSNLQIEMAGNPPISTAHFTA